MRKYLCFRLYACKYGYCLIFMKWKANMQLYNKSLKKTCTTHKGCIYIVVLWNVMVIWDISSKFVHLSIFFCYTPNAYFGKLFCVFVNTYQRKDYILFYMFIIIIFIIYDNMLEVNQKFCIIVIGTWCARYTINDRLCCI